MLDDATFLRRDILSQALELLIMLCEHLDKLFVNFIPQILT